MDDEQFDAAAVFLSPSQKRELLKLRALRSGDPSAVSRHAQQQHNDVRGKLSAAQAKLEKAEKNLAHHFQRVLQLRAE
eukprot:8366020-Pyramimonas_sp.AAC.1